MLRRAGVVGDPAGHSLSPAIHRAGYAANDLDWAYEAYTVAPAELDAFVGERLDDPAWAGLSVTAPHKEAILAFGEADEPTRLLGAGNTLVLGGGGARVFNTDVPGFVRARRPERAGGMLDLAGALGVRGEIRALGDPVDPVDLVANTIPAAATGPYAQALADGARVVFDAVYDPWPTPLGVAAEAAGRVALNGLDLLAGQAVDQFFLLTGSTVTFEGCRSAAEQELRRRAGL